MNAPADDRSADPGDASDRDQRDPSGADPSDDRHTQAEASDDQGPGWMPAIVAAMALLGIFGFIFCAFGTWALFQKRTEFAIRTLQGDYVRQLEQSLLDPDTKTSLMREVERLIADLERGKYENWQSAAIMQRLQRLPVFQWGELQAIEAFLRNPGNGDLSEDERQQGLKELGRLRRAVELGELTSFDFEEVLEPVRIPSAVSPSGHELAQPLESQKVSESIRQAKVLADRYNVPDQEFPDVRIEAIFRQEIELGASQGGY